MNNNENDNGNAGVYDAHRNLIARHRAMFKSCTGEVVMNRLRQLGCDNKTIAAVFTGSDQPLTWMDVKRHGEILMELAEELRRHEIEEAKKLAETKAEIQQLKAVNATKLATIQQLQQQSAAKDATIEQLRKELAAVKEDEKGLQEWWDSRRSRR